MITESKLDNLDHNEIKVKKQKKTQSINPNLPK